MFVAIGGHGECSLKIHAEDYAKDIVLDFQDSIGGECDGAAGARQHAHFGQRKGVFDEDDTE
jgi:hypothetical protein